VAIPSLLYFLRGAAYGRSGFRIVIDDHAPLCSDENDAYSDEGDQDSELIVISVPGLV
jgi:hypothetical protein